MSRTPGSLFRASPGLCEALVASAPFGIIVVDEAGRIRMANRRVIVDFQYEESELLGKPLESLLSKRNGSSLGRRRDGTEFAVEVTLTPLITEEERCTMATVMDVSKRAHDTEGGLVSRTSHELKNPLTVILGFSDLLGEELADVLNESQKDYVKAIRESGTHLLVLINDILDMAKMESGRVDLHLSDFELAGAVEACVGVVRRGAVERGVAIEVRLDGGRLPVCADEARVRQVVSKLLSNAVRFTPGGGTVGVEAAQGDDGMVVVSIWDPGVGFEKKQVRQFQEFDSLDGNRSRRLRETGLGLALMKQLVEMHGGRIWLDCGEGDQGSRFSFSLPARPSPKEVPQ